MTELRRVYFDSEPLKAAEWPSLSQKLVGVIRLASSLGVGCLLPEPVLMELEADWLRDLKGNLGEMGTAWQAVAKALRQVGEPLTSNAPVNLKQITEAYRARVAQVLSEQSLLVVPTTPRDLVEVFELALGRDPPFFGEKDDRGFQDAVILLSVIDHLQQSPESAVFVTADKRLKKSDLGRLVGETLLDLRFTTLEELREELTKHLEAKQQEAWQRDRELARQAIVTAWSELETFLTQNISLLPSDLGFFSTIEGIQAAHARLLRDVTTPFDPDRKEGTNVSISATVEVELEVVSTRTIALEPPRALRVGEEAPPTDALGWFLEQWAAAKKKVVTPTAFVFDVEAEAIFEGAGYSHLEFKKVELKRDEWAVWPLVRDHVGEGHSLPAALEEAFRDSQTRKTS